MCADMCRQRNGAAYRKVSVRKGLLTSGILRVDCRSGLIYTVTTEICMVFFQCSVRSRSKPAQ